MRNGKLSSPKDVQASALGKGYSWGLLFNEEGKIALYGVEMEKYQEPELEYIKDMRSSRS